jgi:PAS domain S-box-containing protein
VQLIEWGKLRAPKPEGAFSYLLVLVLMGLALLVRLALFPLEAGLQYLTFFPAVALAFVIGGFGPGLFSILIGVCLATFIFVPPYYALSLHSLHVAFWSNVVFLVDGIIVGSAVMAMRRQQSKLDSTIDSLKITRQAIEGTSDGYWLCDAAGKLLDVNNSYCRMSGYTRHELLSMHISALEARESPVETAERIRRLIAHECDVFETQHRRKDGKVIDVEISASYVKQGDGYFSVFARDFSERKRIKEKFKQTQMEFEELYDKAPCGYHSIDMEGRILRVNQTEAGWLGYTRDELIGRKITEFHAPSSAATFAADFSSFIQNGHVDNVEVDLVGKDGKPFTVLLSATGEYDADGHYIMNRAAMINITARKQAEEQQRRSDANLRALLDTVPYLIWLKDVDSRFVAVNESFLDTTGFASMDEVLGKSDFELWPEELAAKYRADDIEVLNIRQQKLTVERALSKGELRWVETFKTPILDSMGNLLGTAGFAHDITHRIEQEERRLVEVLEQRDVLVREVHHRIKNNLQGVVGLLRQHASDHPEMREVTDVVIRRIYSIAVIHGLQAQTLTEEVAVDALMKGILEASEGNVSYRNNLHGQVLLSKNEAVPIALVLNELVTNGCKHRSANTQLEVTLGTDRHESVITIENYFEEGRQEATCDGQGLALVNSLLPRNSAQLLALRKGNIYSVVLRLSPPVTINMT